MKQLVKQPSLTRALRAFHEDEGGMQSIEAVVVLAIAACVLVGIYYLWQKATIGGTSGGLLGAITETLGTVFTTVKSFITGKVA